MLSWIVKPRFLSPASTPAIASFGAPFFITIIIATILLKNKKAGIIVVGGAETNDKQYELIKGQFDCISGYLSWDLLFYNAYSATQTDDLANNESAIKELESLGVIFILSDNPTDLLDDSYDIMVKNPGIKYDHPTVAKAKNMGIPVINEVEVAYHYLDHDVNIIGVTGSNGKTTTVSIIYEIMKKAFGDKVFLAGNIGTPLCHFVNDIKSGDYLVMEISDHQLCDMYEFKTNVSVMTNNADFHDGHDKYVQTKKKIFMNHGKDDVNIINKDNKEEMAITRDIKGINYYFNGKDAYFKDGYIYYNDKKIIDTNRIILKGKHNYENIMCAILATKKYGVSDKIIQDVVSNFGGVEHRLEMFIMILKVLIQNLQLLHLILLIDLLYLLWEDLIGDILLMLLLNL